jgi:hypothetical protein
MDRTAGDAMISYSPTLQAIVGAKTGIAPVHLLDVEDCNGNFYYWGSWKISAPCVVGLAGATVPYLPWILSVPQWKFYRSMQTDMGNIQIQNLSGDSLQRDFEKTVRASALEGALFVYREWQADAEEAALEVHGTLSINDSDPETAQLQGKQLFNPSSDTAPMYSYSETCQWRWSSVQCGATGPTPCQQSFPTCQVLSRIFVIANSYEKNYGETTANVATAVQNRIRQF